MTTTGPAGAAPARPLPGRVLVTGAAGRIGGAVSRLLGAEGVAVTALDVVPAPSCAADRVVVGSACDVDVVAEGLQGADAVVHLAAMPHRDSGRPYDVYRTNVSATFNVLSQAGERGVARAVIASSINALGIPMNHHEVMPAYFPLDEGSPADVDDWYSLSKQADEATAQMVHRHWGTDVLALRFPLVDTPEVLRAKADRLEADPAAGAREGWSYLDLRDAAAAVLAGLVAPWSGAHVLMLSAADTLVARPTAELLREHAPGVPVRGDVPGRCPLVDARRARELLGFRPRHSVHAAPPSVVGPRRPTVGRPAR